MTFNAQEFNSTTVNGIDFTVQIHRAGHPTYWIKKLGFYNPSEEFINDGKPFVQISSVIGKKGYQYKITNGANTEYRDDYNDAMSVAGEMAA